MRALVSVSIAFFAGSLWACPATVTSEQNINESSENPAWAETAYAVSLAGDVHHGVLRLTGRRYSYEASDVSNGDRPFYFVTHPEGEFRFEHSSGGAVGLLHFDPEGPDYNPADPRRTLQVRRTADGGFVMHSIVSEFQEWRIKTP